MGKYQIIELEQLVGVKAHTIRIWEKRYGIIKPHRTQTNIRYYDDEQVRKLLNVTTLLNSGYKISKVAALSEKEITELISKLYQAPEEDVISTLFVSDLIASMLSFNEPAFEKTFSSSINRFGLYNGMLKVVYPFLQKVGLLWSTNEAMPVQEHFASSLIKRKLMAAIDGLPVFSKAKKSFLLFLPPDEWHEIALLFSEYIIREKGFKVTNLGQNVPVANIKKLTEAVTPTHLVTFFISGKNRDVISDFVDTVGACLRNSTLLIGGSAGNLKSVTRSNKVTVLASPNDLLNFL